MGEWSLLLVPCLTLTGPFTTGVAYVTRNWARDEHAFIWSDFIDTVKGKLRVSVQIFGRSTPVEVEFNQAEKVEF